jgi:hypothetical protein
VFYFIAVFAQEFSFYFEKGMAHILGQFGKLVSIREILVWGGGSLPQAIACIHVSMLPKL